MNIIFFKLQVRQYTANNRVLFPFSEIGQGQERSIYLFLSWPGLCHISPLPFLFPHLNVKALIAHAHHPGPITFMSICHFT